MSPPEVLMTEPEKACFNQLNQGNVQFLRERYNRVNRWVIADMVRRTAYHHPEKTAIIFGDQSLSYAQMEVAANRTANALGGLGVKKYDRVAILAHNTIHHTGGENVSTREVEEAIYKDTRVEEVAVIGTPHPKWVEAVTAVVVLRKGATMTEAEVIDLCKGHLAGFKLPKAVVFVDALPKTPTGKILKREMRTTYKALNE